MEERVASIGDLADGQMMKVTVGGEDALLARVEGRLYATAARCPHWGGPLPQGLLSGPRLLCPWHKATFDVRDGSLLEPPAMDSVASYAVRVAGDDVYVERPENEGASEGASGADVTSDSRLFAIIGGGAAAAAAAETLRHEGYCGRIVMISPETRVPYDRPNLSKDYMAGEVGPDMLPLRAPDFYAQSGIERVAARVTRLDVHSRRLELTDGDLLEPDAVLVASGAEPRRLPVPGGDLPGVFTLRTPEDADAILAAAGDGRKVVVVGTSFIGMEVAASLARRDLDVTVVGLEAAPFAGTLGETVGRMLQALHEEHGNRFVLGNGVASFSGAGAVSRVVLENGDELEADLVVIGVGVQPVTDFVSGLEADDDGGLAVDDRLRLADGVWAAGDVARYRDAHTGRSVRIEHWRLAEQHGRSAAADMAGHGRPFTGVPFFWTKHFDLSLGHAGVTHAGIEPLVFGDLARRKFTALYAEDDELLAACGTQQNELGAFMELMAADALPPLSDVRDRDAPGLEALLGELTLT